MAKTTGFLEFERETAQDRPIEERIRDWQPIHLALPETKLTRQAARCMDCGTPFCHTGQVLNGMASGCPINNLIPEWNDLVYRGLWREAYDRLSKTNNFPEFTGHVCPAPCEAACTLGITDPPVTIKQIELAIIEKAFAEGWVRPYPQPGDTGRKVAVIGSGPAGLACADQLNRAGHAVTVFERAGRAGGLLAYGIPNMKLDKRLVQRRVDVMAAAGVQFVTGAEVGRDITAAALQHDFDAIVLCTGAAQPRDLPVPGRELAGIEFAVPYLSESCKQMQETGDWRLEIDQSPISNLQSPLSATGKDVIVIGGGDTGTDCVATAVRQGCRSLVQFEIMPQPPLERAEDNPWPQWPRIFRVDYGQAEAAAVFGRDPRRYEVMTMRFEGDEQGRVTAVHTVQITWQNGKPVPIPGTEKRWPAQLVLLALGFVGAERPLLAQFNIQQSTTNGQRPRNRYRTNVDGVFMAGDARRGQSLVVWAIREGREAARAVDLWLMGETDLP